MFNPRFGTLTITTIKHKTSQYVVINLETKLLKAIQFCVWLLSVSNMTQRNTKNEKINKWKERKSQTNYSTNNELTICQLDTDEERQKT